MLTAICAITGPQANAAVDLTAERVRAEYARDPDALVDLMIAMTGDLPARALTDDESVRLAEFVARRARGDARTLAQPARVMRLLGPAGTAEVVRRIDLWMDFDHGYDAAMRAQLNFAEDARESVGCDAALTAAGADPTE